MLKKLLLLVTLLTVVTAGQNITGSGTSGDPYILYNAIDVDSIRYLGLTNDYHYKLGADIDFTGFGEFVPFTSRGFNLDGSGFEMRNLTTIKKQLCMGMIDTLYAGVNDSIYFKNLDIRGFRIVYDSTQAVPFSGLGRIGVGLLIGYVNGSDESKLTFNKIKFINNAIWVRVNNWAASSVGSAVGRIDTLRQLTFYQTLVDSSLIWNLQANGQTSLSYAGGYVGLIDTTDAWFSAMFREAAIRNSTVFSYDWDDRSNAGGFIGAGSYIVLGSDFKRFDAIDCYTKNLRLSLVFNFAERGGGLIGDGDDIDTISVYNFYQVGMRITNQLYDTLATANNGEMGTIVGDAFTQKVYSENIYVDTTKVWTYDNGVDIGSPHFNNYPYAINVTELTPEDLKNQATFTGFNFVDIWDIDPAINDGYPFHTWGTYNESNVNIWSPGLGSVYYANDTVSIGITLLNVDTLLLEYTDDNEFSWTLIDTLYATNLDTGLVYNWINYPLGEYDVKIKITSLTRFGNPDDISPEFSIISRKEIDILSPINQAIQNIGGSLQDTIIVRCQNIDKFSLYYSIGDTLTWTTIAIDIPVTELIDTISYIWTLPQEFGQLYILAREISDTAQYDFERPGISLGNTKRSYPQICWYMQTYFGATFTNYDQNPIEWNWVVDQSCGWISGDKERVTALIDDKAEGHYTFYSDRQPLSFAKDNPIQAGGVYLYTISDTNYVRFGDFYSLGSGSDTLLYKNRNYFIVSADSTLRCKDLINNIDSILITDLTPYFSTTFGWYNLPNRIAIYNVQHSKINGQYFPVNQDFESLNDSDFKGKLLMTTNQRGGGYLTIGVELLDEPIDAVWVQDIENIYSQISYTRDYFRGIDPKARKTR